MPKKTRWSAMNKNNTPFSKLREQFAVYNKTTGKSPATVSWYEQKLELFERWLGPDACLADVTIPNVRAYIAELQERTTRWDNNPKVLDKQGGLSSSYIHSFARGLRAFATWLHEDGFTDTNVLKALKPPKFQQKVTEPLSDEEVKRLVAVFDRDEPFGARGYAMVWTLLDCGLRASELCDLKTEDAHLDAGYLKVLGKGNKERLVPIGQSCQDALLRWRDRFREQFANGESPHLFLDSNGQRLTVNALTHMVLRAGQRADVRRVHLHLLRHTFATNYLVKEVGDPLRLQQILGHTSLEMVRRYVAMANVQQSLIERRASPMDLIVKSAGASNQRRQAQPRRPRRALRVVK
ncbi:MAG: tyrosine-type recombinase/integrase [Dehalococcoidia bacterium]